MQSVIDALASIDWSIWGSVIAIVLLLAFSAFFSGAETALTAASRAKLHAIADRGSKRAQTALDLIDDSERMIGSVLFGNNVVNILSASLATNLIASIGGGKSGVLISTAIMTVLIVVFSEVMPKTYAITNAERAAIRLAPFVKFFVALLSPIVTLVRAVVRFLLRLLGVQTDPDANIMAAHEEIAGAISLHHSEGTVEKADRDRLLGALDLRHREVEEIMLHRSSIEMVDAADDPAKILSQCLQSAYTRLPIFRDDPDNIVGVIHAKDLLRAVDKQVRGKKGGIANLDKFNILEVAMPPYFIPNSTSLDDQMREFLKRKSHFALVVDEYGSLQGLITLEDILEEIVGEIADEHDVEEEVVQPNPDGSVEVDGAMTIRDLNRACEWNLPDEEANTVAGLVIHEAQTIPNLGQIFTFHGFRIEVLERDRNRLTRLRLRKVA